MGYTPLFNVIKAFVVPRLVGLSGFPFFLDDCRLPSRYRKTLVGPQILKYIEIGWQSHTPCRFQNGTMT